MRLKWIINSRRIIVMNDKELEQYRADFGRLTLRSAMVSKMILDYQKELAEVNKELDEKYKQITGVKEDGSTVCEEK